MSYLDEIEVLRDMMSTTKALVSILALLLWLANSHAQTNTDISHITEEDGLPYRWVFDITQDRNGFLWFATFDGLSRYDGTRYVTYKHTESDTNSISSSQVRHVAEDAHGGIWTYGDDLIFNRLDQVSGLVTKPNTYFKNDTLHAHPSGSMRYFTRLSNGDFIALFQKSQYGESSLWKYAPKKNAFDHIINVPGHGGSTNFYSECADNCIWLWGVGAGYYLVDLATQEIRLIPVDHLDLQLTISAQVPVDKNRDLWYPAKMEIGDETGCMGQLSKFRLPVSFDLQLIRRYRMDNMGNIWMNYGEEELYHFDTKLELLEKYVNPVFGTTADHLSMYRIFVDQEGAGWIGHFYGAVRFRNQPALFNTYLSQLGNDQSPKTAGFSARNIIQLTPSRILVKDNNYDLFAIDLETGRTEKIDRKPLIASNDYVPNGGHSMLLGHDGYLWNNQTYNLVKTNLKTGLFETFDAPDYQKGDFPRIFEDDTHNLWWCSANGLYIFDRVSEKMTPVQVEHQVPSVSGNFSYGSYDPVEDLIYGAYDRGVYIIDCKNKSSSLLEIFSENEGEYLVMAILKWHQEFWLSTNYGLVRFNPDTKERIIYTKKDGLPSDIIYGTLGSENDLWLATHNGLCQFNPDQMQMATYYDEQGLPNNEFNRWSYLKTEDGQMFFGGLSGIIGFDPKSFKIPERRMGQLNLVEYSKYSEKEDDEFTIQVHPYTPIEHIVISPSERTLTFDYMLSIFEDVDKNQYFHYMEGLERDWIEDGNQNEVRYNQIPPGDYIFRVKAVGPDKMAALNELAIPVFVEQYWYLKWWAIAIYIIVIGIAIGTLYKFQLRSRLNKEEISKIRELEEIKTRMYTNITHEFRTPLTVMLGMNDAQKEYAIKGEQDKVFHANEMIDRNGKNLLSLVNQMLDLSKLESGMLNVHNRQGDIIVFLKYCFESFQSYAAEKDIQIHFQSTEDEVVMDYDPDKITHVVSNLSSNAIKFTPENGHIYVNAGSALDTNGKPCLELKVRDTGIGIEASELDSIFKRFYQVEDGHIRKGEGTGIGLSLVKEIIKLLNGTIDVESKIDEGTEFKVLLPIKNKAPLASTVRLSDPVQLSAVSSYALPDEDTFLSVNEDLPLVLIAEDNADVMHYIRISIKDDYRTVVAKDGAEGIDMAIALIPDLIISDVMMPVKDGYELCEVVKKDERTSHIPVILLTAKTDQDSRIEGLEHGADAYLAKPFNQKELLIRIRNLMALREELQKRYAQTDFTKPLSRPASVEDTFLIKIRSSILENIEEEEFNVVHLCKLNHLSRAQLHRKLIAITGQSTSQLIRAVRLEKAKELLSTDELNVSEVAYQVGFKTQAHFSRVFSETFGMPPSDYRKK